MGHLAILLLAGSLSAAQIDLDCGAPAAARALVGRLALSEIEGAEDINRAAMWDAFGRCPPGPARQACAESQRRHFEAEWQRQKARIEAKYRKILDDFEARCRASLAREPLVQGRAATPGVGGPGEPL